MIGFETLPGMRRPESNGLPKFRAAVAHGGARVPMVKAVAMIV
jgi:hypothetical protein